MATKLYLHSTTSSVSDTGDGVVYQMTTTAPTPGPGSLRTVDLVASGTNIQWTATSGGSTIAWISPTIGTGFTLTTTDIAAIFAESNMNDNAGGRFRIYKYTPGTPTITELAGGPFDDGVEFDTSETTMAWVGNPTDTAFSAGDRILLRIFATNVGVMTAGTADLRHGGSTGEFFNIAETITFAPDPLSVSVNDTVTVTDVIPLIFKLSNITFLDPGGDSTQVLGSFSQGGFWSDTTGASLVTDIVHGSHGRSIRSSPGVTCGLETRFSTLNTSGTGNRISFYVFFDALPTATADIMRVMSSAFTSLIKLRMTSGGVLQATHNDNTQFGSNGATLVRGQWYRISLAYTVAGISTNRFEFYVDGVSTISLTNQTLATTGSSLPRFGNMNTDATLDMRMSDFYIDGDSSLADTGDFWVTAKRPNANGTNNNFVTQIGAGGSGYGSGHSPQVNERPLSATNGWAITTSGSAVTEEYAVEGKSTGDINIEDASIRQVFGWVYAKSLASITGQIKVRGATSNISLTSSDNMFIKDAQTSAYPAGGTDIGIVTDTTVTTVSLYEAGIMIVYIPTPYTFEFENITVTENLTIKVVALFLSVFDEVTVTDVFNSVLPGPQVIVFDTVTITENLSTLNIPLPVSVFDLVTVTDIPVYPDDTVWVEEWISIQVSGEAGISLSVFDTVTVTENIVLNYSLPSPISDTVTVTENISLSIPLPISVFDEVTVTENVSLSIPLPFSVFDEVIVTENISLSIPLPVFVFDTATITEDIVLTIPILYLLVFDTVTVTENFQSEVVSYLSVFDQVTITENIKPSYSLPSPISDTITVTEQIYIGIETGNRYWIGGTGSWADNSHWSYVSGGAGFAAQPNSTTNVFIDANSGFGAGGTISAVGNAEFCKDFTANTGGHSYTISSNGYLDLYGSFYLESTVTFGWRVDFDSAIAGQTITTNGVTVNSFAFSGAGAWTLQDNLTLSVGFYLDNGTFNANNFNVTAAETYITASTGAVPTLNMGSGTWLMDASFPTWSVEEYNGEIVTINAGTSTIKLNENVAFSNDRYFVGGGKTYNIVWSSGASTGGLLVFGSNTFSEFKDTGSAAHYIKFENGTTSTITTWSVSGTAGNVITINSDNTAVHNLVKAGGGTVAADYLNIQHSVATPGTLTWYAGNNSVNNQGVADAGSGWIFTDPPKLISVFDTVTVTENIVLSIPLPVFVFDSVTVTEDIVLSIPLPVSVFDEITVTENISITISSGNIDLSIFDAVTVTENIVLSVPLPVFVFDTVTITDVNTQYIPILFLSVSDLVTVTENIVLSIPLPINVNDTVTVTEDIVLSIPLPVNVFDNVVVTENIVLSISLPSGGIFETVTVTENIVLSIPLPVSVFDEVTITENIVLSIPLPVFVYEDITVTDVDDLYIPILYASVSDNVYVFEGPLYTQLTAGPSDPGTATTVASGGGGDIVGWQNPDNAKVSDNIYTIAVGGFSEDPVTSTTNILKLTNFGFNLPPSIVVGVKVSIEKKSSHDSGGNYVVDNSLLLNKANDTASSSERADVTTHWGTAEQTVNYGGETDLWGESLTYADINSSNFGVRFIARIFNNTLAVTASIDNIKITVYYYVDGLPKLEVVSYVNVSDLVTVTENVSAQAVINISVFDEVTVTENIALSIPLPGGGIFDTVTVTEDIVLSIPLPVSVFDEVTVSENISLSIPLPVFTSDLVTITEDVVLNIPISGGGIFELVTVSEDIVLSIPLPVNVFDLVTVTDVNTQYIPTLYLSVNDLVTITEDIVLSIPLPVFVFDEVTVTENIQFTGVLSISVSDTVTVTEAIQISYSLPPIFDQVTITENIVLSIPLPVDVFDLVTVTDVNTQYIPILFISVVENVTIDEFFQTGGQNTFFVFDLVTITEDINLYIPIIYISVSELVTVSEDIVLSIPLPVNVFDSVTVSEDIVLSIPLPVNVFDSVTVSENIVLSIPLPVSVVDLVTVTDVISLYITSYFLSVSDTVTVTENFSSTGSSYVNVFDTVTVTENIQVFVGTGSSLFETVTITENIVLSIPLPVSVFDIVTVTENFDSTGTAYLSVFDTVTITENIQVFIVSASSLFDTVTVTENIVLSIPLPVSVFDTVTITEDINLYITTLFVSVFDTVTVTEDAFVATGLIVFENITITEDINIFIPILYLSVSDTVTVSEDIVLALNPVFLSVFDTVTVTENVAIFLSENSVSIFDTVTVTEDVVVYIPVLFLSVFDAVTITEVFTSVVSSQSDVFDLIVVTESVSVSITLNVSVFDTVTVSENLSPALPLTLSTSDSVTVTESTSFVLKKYGHDIPSHRPQGHLVEYRGLGSIHGESNHYGTGTGY